MLALPRHATQARVGAEWLLHALAGGGELIRLGFLAQRTGTLADFEHTDAHHVWLVDALPKGPTGKIVKREIAPRRTSHEDRHQRPGRGYHPCLI
jgi:hypothetical protein